jgi:hypothetical protein
MHPKDNIICILSLDSSASFDGLLKAGTIQSHQTLALSPGKREKLSSASDNLAIQ